MVVLRNTVLIVIVLIGFFTNNLNAQVNEVQFQMKYDTTHCWYDCYLIIKSGSAPLPNQRVQFNANYSLVLPTGSSYTIDSLYNPIRSDNGQPMNWLQNESVISPAADPAHDFHTIIPEISPISRYTQANEGDTIKLFSITVDPMPACGEGVRLHENGVDPTSSDPGMMGADFQQGFTMGGFIQIYDSNVPAEGPPGPDNNAEIGCVDGIYIDLNPITSSCSEPLTFSWTGPNYSGIGEDVIIPVRDPSDEGIYEVIVEDAIGCKDTFYFDVQNKPNGGGDLIACSGTTITLNGSDPSNGTWMEVATNSPGATLGPTNSGNADVTFDPSANGIYNFYYEFNGCGDTIEVTVNSGASLPTISGDASVCEGEDINLTTDFVVGGTYTWSGPDGFSSSAQNPTIPSATLAKDGQYTLIVSANGCDSGMGTFDVEVKPLPIATPSNDGPICEGEDLQLSAVTVPGGTYSWSGPDGFNTTAQNPTISGVTLAKAGTYTLIVFENGCQSIAATTEVVINPEPTAPIISNNGPLCVGEQLDLTSTNVTNASYFWTGPNNFFVQNPSISNVSLSDAGTYNLEIEVNGCRSQIVTTDVIVNPNPSAPSLSNNGPLCEGEQLELTSDFVSGATYTWTGPNNFSVQNPIVGNVTNSDAGTYTLQISVGGCTSSPVTTDVVVKSKPASPILSNNGPLCEGEQLELTSDFVSGGTYTWTGPNNFSVQNPTLSGVILSDAGTYTLVITVDGCDSDPATTEVIVKDTPAPPIVNNNGPLCEGDQLELTATNIFGATYNWTGPNNFNVQNPIISNVSLTDAGTYNVVATVDGCSSPSVSTDVVVKPNPPTISVDSDNPYCVGDDIILTPTSVPGANYTWTLPNFTTSNDEVLTIPNANFVNSGNYILNVELDGCDANQVITTINVISKPTVDAGSHGPFCIGDAPQVLDGNPSGGVFSGNGINSNEFDPDVAGIGSHTLTYTITSGNGCSNEATTIVEVNDVPVVNISSFGPLCLNDGIVSLNGTPVGGIFSGTGVSGSDFDPSVAGVGTHTITYDYTDGNGCSNSATVDIIVNDLPVVDAGTYAPLCIDAGVISLSGTPVGGTFSGTGVIGTDFDPSVTGVGTHTITYNYTDGNGCSNSATVDIVVNDLPVVDAGTYAPLCIDAGVIGLSGTPVGGTFNGTGVSGSDFDPSVTGVGTHTITYDYTDGNGCSNSATVDIVVNDLPVVDAGTYAPLCIDAGVIGLSGTPVGGTFSGTGVSGSDFDPSVAGAGTHTITYNYTDGNGCSNIATVDIVVNDLPVIDAGTYAPLCIDAGVISLSGAPVGGTFSGVGVSGSDFDPSVAGAGMHTITYDYTDGNGCSNSATVDIVVNDLPVVDAGTYAPLCIDAGVISLSGTPAGGSYLGTGVVGTDFDPSVAGVGTHTITYDYTDGNGCSNSATVDIIVNDLPVVDAGTYAPLCIDAGVISLSGTPVGGTFSGTGVSGSDFDPSVAGSGTHTITYNYTDGNGCSNSATVDIVVNDLPVVDAGTYAPLCIDAGVISLSGTPVGGTFSGTGVIGTDFDPSVAGAGTHTITYNYTDGNGCSNSATVDIVVNDLPVVDAGTYAPLCIDAGVISLSGTPVGGTFSGTGVIGTDFDPSVAGAGTHTITYDYTDGNGCSNSATVDIVVNDLPVVDAGTYAPLCIDAGVISLSGTPSGGSYLGTGVVGTDFDPSVAGAGTHTITYNYTDGNGCSNSATVDIVVNELPVVDAGTYAPLCLDAGIITLNATPAGGSYLGTGVIGNDFDPSAAGVGTHTITYNYTDGNGCSNSATVDIVVNDLPVVDAGTHAPLCVDAGIITLNATPAGGSYLGTGVIGNDFDPSAAGVGTHTITYNYTDGNGCSNSATVDIVVNDLPVVDAGTYAPLCIDAGIITLNATPAGGSYLGTGVIGNDFDPSAAGVGTHTITYNYTDGNGCSNSATVDIVVNDLPVVDAGTYAPLCIDAGVISLSGTPLGGTFSGTGVSGSDFDPSAAGVGTHTITYNYTDGNGCSNSATVDIVVNELPVVDAGTYAPLCVDAGIITLNATPAGGSYLGTGVIGNDFDPSAAGVGTHTITYNYTDGSGCSNSATVDIVVNELPVVDAGTYAPLCVDAGIITLNATPAGGSYLGTGVIGNDFDPSVAGVGTHTITYNYTDGNGCSNSATVDIVVNELPVVDAGTYAPLCIDAGVIGLSGTPIGGTFSGTGVSGSDFDPSVAGAGTHTITYNYTDSNGCSNSATVDILVNDLPVVDAGTYAPLCIDAGVISLSGTPSGGSYLGTGVVGTDFDPSVAGAGTHTITYNYTDGNGCSNSATVDIVVNDLPVVDAGTYAPLCIDAGIISLSGTPTGGSYLGTGVVGTDFDPSVAGVGTHTITYNYTDGNGCSNSATVDIVVNDLPVVDAGTYAPLCIDAGVISLSGTPSGGSYLGTGVVGTDFDPGVAGAGTHTITYNYTDGNGCSNSATVDIVVNDLPVVDAGTYAPLCIDAGVISLSGTPSGGSYLGTGVVGTDFDPSVAGAGTHTITYNYTDGNGCSNSTTVDIVVNDLPVVDAGTYAPLCIDAGVISLSGTPSGGSYLGTGVVGTDFDPSVAGAGTHTITYNYTDGNGCSNSATVDIVVNDLPVVDAGTYAPLCIDAGVISLSGTPSGGSYLGTGVVGTDFDPSVAGAGTHTITYNYTDGNGCSNSATVDIVVNDLPVVDAGTYVPLCIDAGVIGLSGTPIGGTFSGSGVSGSDFDPSAAGAGTHTITYNYTDGNGCSNSATVDIVVNDLPVVDAGTYAPLCIDAGVISLSGTPSGGSYQGTGVVGTDFDPSVAGAGTNTITYNYTDGNGCSNSATVDIVVNDLPVVDAGTYSDLCLNDLPIILNGTPSNGVFTGNGVVGNQFDPSISGAGTHQVLIEFTDTNGCFNSETTQITVSENPNLELVMVECSADLLNYSVTFNTNGIVSSDAGTVNGNQIVGIPTGTDVMITALGNSNCETTLSVSSPDCSCDDIPSPTLGNNGNICQGEINPELKVDVQTGLSADWYDAPINGTLLASGTLTYIPLETGVGTYTYYVEARNPIDECTSSTRIPVELEIKEVPQITNTLLLETICTNDLTNGFEFTSQLGGVTYNWIGVENNVSGSILSGSGNIPSQNIITTSNIQGSVLYTVTPSLNGCAGDPVDFQIIVNPEPEITIDLKECSADLTSYTITFTSGASVSADNGLVVSGNQVLDVPSGQDVVLTITDVATNCTSTMMVSAPDCSCDVVNAPVVNGGEICEGDAIPQLSATAGQDETVDWYDASTGGTLVASGAFSYTPTETTPGVYTYYTEARNEITGCVSDTRTPVTFTINALPTATIDLKECSADLTSYTITFTSGGTVSADNGLVLSGNQVLDVPSGQDVVLTITDGVTNCTSTMMVSAPDCSCDVVNAPVVNGGEICEGDAIPQLSATAGQDETVDWYDASTGGTQIASGVFSITPTETTPGVYTYYTEARNEITGCVSDTRTPVTFTINALPTATIDLKECSADLTSYTITFTSGGTVSADNGLVVSGNQVLDVPSGQDVLLTITDGVTNCTSTMMVSAPDCDCDVVNAPLVNGGEICEGDAIPQLSATAGQDETVDWYDASTGGTLVASGAFSYTPTETTPGVYTYYTEARNEITGCVSDTRTPVTFTINALPTATIDLKECSADLTSYTITFTSGGTVSADNGLVVSGNQVLDVPSGQDVLLTITDGVTNCTSTMMVSAPDCDCDVVNAPLVNGGEICEGDAIPQLSATAGQDETVDWYDASTGGTLVASGAFSYTPTETTPGVYTYYTEARNEITGCVSDTRTPVTFTINALPTATIDLKECSADLTSYTITFTSGGTVSADNGLVVSGNQVLDVPSGQDVLLTITDGVTNCTSTMMVSAPDCDCDVVNAPLVNGGEICEGDAIPQLSATAGQDETVDWYDASTGGTLVASGAFSYTPTETTPGVYTYYTEARNEITGCVSDTRTPVTFTINALPTAIIDSKDCSNDNSSYTITFTSGGTVSADNGLVVSGNQVLDVPSGQDVVLTITDGVTNCTSTMMVSAPDCGCDVVNAPVVNGGEICEGDAIPQLSATAGQDETVDWYDASTGGTLVASGAFSYTPTETTPGVYTYYTEARNEITGCVSDTRTPVTFTINALPTAIIDSKDCSNDNSSYTITFISGASVSANNGLVVSGNQVLDVPSGQDVVLTITDGVTNCTSTMMVSAPDCGCEVVNAPVVNGGEICEGDAVPQLSATAGQDETVDWYDASTGGTLLASGVFSFTPAVTIPGVYTYYTEARNEITGCVSDTRTPVTFTINALPTASIDLKECSADLTSYTITFTSGGTVSADNGLVVSGNQVLDIPSGQDVVLTITDVVTNCTSTMMVSAPDCDCGLVNAPVVIGGEICEGDVIPQLSATAGQDETVDWYDASTGGTLVASGVFSFTPTETTPGVYTYYVETRNVINGCVSDTRTPVTFTINGVPTILNTDLEVTICESDIFNGFTILSDIQNTIFTWTSVANNVIGATQNGSGNIILDNLSLNGSDKGSVVYTVTPINNGCLGNPVDFIVNINPTPNAGVVNFSGCYRDAEITLNAEGVGSWEIGSQNDGDFDITSLNDGSAVLSNFTSAGTYQLTWTVDGCTDILSFDLDDNCPCDIDGNNIIPPFDDVFCEDTGDLTIIGNDAAPAGGVYLWQFKVDNNTFEDAPGVNDGKDLELNNFGPGKYEVRRLYFINGQMPCVDTSNVIDFFVYSKKVPAGPIDIDPFPVCAGDSITLSIDANPDLDYFWSVTSGGGRILFQDNSSAMLYAESAGIMTVVVTHSYEGCNDDVISAFSETEIMVNQLPRPFLGYDTTYCEIEEPRTLDAGEYESYLWQDGTDDRYLVIDEEGEYSVSVIDSLGCEGGDLIRIKKFCCEFAMPNIINIHSQSFNDQFSITDIHGCVIDSDITIFDRWGNVVYRSNDGLSSWDGKFDGRPVEQGVYVFIFNYTAEDADNQQFEEVISGDITVIR